MRQQAAALSVALGLAAVVSLINNPLYGWATLGCALCVLGGLAGVGVWIFRDPFPSRRCGMVALGAIGLGIALLALGQ
ncbi:MAG: hypothetical protein KJO75_11125 [Dactylosporangium sp.]|nr:hypothetical protein [Dactylosporangium sp.]